MTLQSMTGFGTVSGEKDGVSWSWEIRSVNGRGLDVRLRLPDGAESLEPFVRAEVAKQVARGNVSVNLKLASTAENTTPALIPDNLKAVIAAAKQVQEMSMAEGLDIAPITAGDLLAQKWIWETGQGNCDDWLKIAKAQLAAAITAFIRARESEGAAIAAVLSEQINRLTSLAKAARQSVSTRNAQTGGAIREKILALLEITEVADENRLAQELATIAVKADVNEELDRLDAHISAANKLLSESGPIGRKFDFLMQEFNREANTLCSKSGDSALTAIGLELKVVIDQMREQVQNLE